MRPWNLREREMIHHSERIIGKQYKNYSSSVVASMTSFNNNYSTQPTSFGEVASLADSVLKTAEAAEKDSSIVVPKSEQKDYARAKYGFKKKDLEIIIPPTWNPSTHYHCNDFRPLTPGTAKLELYETPEAGWIVHEEEEGYLSETGENVIFVPKAEQATFARKKYGIKDLAIIPPDWNPSTHYCSGDFRPLTPGFSPLLDESIGRKRSSKLMVVVLHQ